MQKPVDLHALTKARLTGELTHNSPEINRHAVQALLDGDEYWSYSIDRFRTSPWTYEEALSLVVASLGMTATEFEASTQPYIKPEMTVRQLNAALSRLRSVARSGGRIMLATGHPGSLLSLYSELGMHLTELGATLVRLDAPVAVEQGRWLDDVGGVICVSDEGSLQHTHGQEGLEAIISKYGPQIVVGDHGMVGAAVNSGTPAVAFFDTDDPGVPLAAAAGADVTPVPLNDNQTNALTAAALRSFIQSDGD